MNFPFSEVDAGGARVRTFSKDIDPEELVWHRDEDDRVIRVLESAGWYFQRDGELPIELRPGDVIHVPQRSWHRVIRRGESRLVVEIATSTP